MSDRAVQTATRSSEADARDASYVNVHSVPGTGSEGGLRRPSVVVSGRDGGGPSCVTELAPKSWARRLLSWRGAHVLASSTFEWTGIL